MGMGTSTLKWRALVFIPLSRLYLLCVQRIHDEVGHMV